MMRKNIVLVFMLILVLVNLPISSAESFTEPTGDVFHWWQSGGTFTWEYDSSKSDIDITEYSYDISGGTLTLSMSVAGKINSGELYSYTISFINEQDGGTYMVTCVGGNATTFYYSMMGGGSGQGTVSGGTLTGSFDTTIDNPSNYAITVTAHQYTVMDDVTSEYWVDSNVLDDNDGGSGDTGGDDTSGDDSGGDDTGGDTSDDNDDSGDIGESNDDGTNTDTPPPSGTPGFELFALITAFAAIVLILKKRS